MYTSIMPGLTRIMLMYQTLPSVYGLLVCARAEEAKVVAKTMADAARTRNALLQVMVVLLVDGPTETTDSAAAGQSGGGEDSGRIKRLAPSSSRLLRRAPAHDAPQDSRQRAQRRARLFARTGEQSGRAH